METRKINTDLAAINKGVEAIKKNRKNKEQGYAFRGIDDAYNMLHDLFADAGVIILPKIISMQREERRTKSGNLLIYTTATYEISFVSDDGSRETITLAGEGMDTGDKSLNKAFSAALKYALLSMFLIPTDDLKDSENETHELAPEEKVKPTPPPPPPAMHIGDAPAEKKPISDNAFSQLCDKLRANPEPKDRGNLLAKVRRYYLPFSQEQENIISQITDN